MDNNDPNNPNPNLSQGTPPQSAQLPPNPWETPVSPPPPASDLGSNPLPDPMGVFPSQPASLPQMESSLPGLPNTTSPALNTQMPQSSLQQNPTVTNPASSNPFLQPQAPQQTPPPTDPGIFSEPSPTSPADPTQPGISEPPAPIQSWPVQNPEAASSGNPFESISPQDTKQSPLNTAFASTPDNTNPFSPPEASAPGSIPETSVQPPQSPFGSLDPVGTQTTTQPENPLADMNTGPASEKTIPAPLQHYENAQIPSDQAGTLDLSSLQANSTSTLEGTPVQPGNSLPETGPVENAPTDLSHLIAGEESNQQPGDIYTPPVASDHNPGLNPTQPQTSSSDGAPPQEKHLNLTKVLLVAGIPIILIVAAISAYIFFGVGKSSPQPTTNQTSLPAVQTKPEQAPLTNPPQQIVAPSPAVVPNPKAPASPNGSLSTPSGTLPGASSTSAMSSVPNGSPSSALEQLKARQAASPSTPTTLP